MKLLIKRSQSKGMMGGVSFEVSSRIQFTDEERRLIDHYNLGNEVLQVSNKRSLVTGRPNEVKVKTLLNGDTYKAKDLTEVMAYTDEMVEACQGLKTYIDLARKFGGEEVIDIS